MFICSLDGRKINRGMEMGRPLLSTGGYKLGIGPFVYKFGYLCKGQSVTMFSCLAAISCSLRVYLVMGIL